MQKKFCHSHAAAGIHNVSSKVSDGFPIPVGNDNFEMAIITVIYEVAVDNRRKKFSREDGAGAG